MNIIKTFDLTKKYLPPTGLKAMLMRSPVKNEVLAVDKVNIKVKKGELFGLIGPNGAGKTTLIKLLCTLLWPTSGKAEINGHDLAQEEKVKSSIGFVSGEERSFYWRLTGRQNLEFFSSLNNLYLPQSERRIDEVFEQVGLVDAADNMFYSYSSGMKQKLCIARGLLTDPAILFLDEPTKSVDAITAINLKRFIKEDLVKKQERTVFLTSHRLEEVEQLCDRIAIMDHGRVSFCGTVAELEKLTGKRMHYEVEITGLKQAKLEELLKLRKVDDVSISPQGPDNLISFEFSFSNGENPLPLLMKDILSDGGSVISCNRRQVKLEQMFVKIIQGEENA